MAEPAAQPGAVGATKRKNKVGLWVGLGAVLLLCAGGGLYVFMGRAGSGHAPKPAPPVRYTALDHFVSNLASEGSLHYIEVTIELKSRNPKVPTEVTKHRPEIRDAILNILADQSLPDVAMPAGREVLRRKILDAVNAILVGKADPAVAGTTVRGRDVETSGGVSAKGAPRPGPGPILGVYFTAFVVQ